MRLLLAVILLTCIACTTTSLTKRGANQEAYVRDDAVCQKQARWLGIFYSDSRYRDCMLQRGYVIK